MMRRTDPKPLSSRFLFDWIMKAFEQLKFTLVLFVQMKKVSRRTQEPFPDYRISMFVFCFSIFLMQKMKS